MRNGGNKIPANFTNSIIYVWVYFFTAQNKLCWLTTWKCTKTHVLTLFEGKTAGKCLSAPNPVIAESYVPFRNLAATLWRPNVANVLSWGFPGLVTSRSCESRVAAATRREERIVTKFRPRGRQRRAGACMRTANCVIKQCIIRKKNYFDQVWTQEWRVHRSDFKGLQDIVLCVGI